MDREEETLMAIFRAVENRLKWNRQKLRKRVII